MKNVTVTTRLELALTAEDWQLYRSVDGAAKAAYSLNREIEKALNEAASPVDASHTGYKALRNYDKYGATDSEPCAVLNRLIGLRFPSWRDR